MSSEFHTSGQQPSSPQARHRHGTQFRVRTWALVTGAGAAAAAGLLVPGAAYAAQVHAAHYPDAAVAAPGPYPRSSAPGGARVGGQQPQSAKITQITMTIKNSTGQILNLVDAEHSGTDVHWGKQAPPTIAVGGSATVSAYSDTRDTTVDVTYQGAYDDALYKLHGVASVDADGNTASGSSDSSSYTVASSIGAGFYPDATYNVEPGGTFDYTGQTTQYTVPVGIAKLNLEAIGGGTLGDGSHYGTGGAQVTGTVPVTPGERLLIGVASSGNWGGHDGSKTAAGWGMTYDGDNYSGGSVNINAGQVPGKAGGGATVVVDEDSGSIIAVAGGGGGNGLALGQADCPVEYKGGSGGENGSWTGGNGNPWPGGGGQAGANTSTEGQPSADVGLCVAGAGGGGAKGGLAAVANSAFGGGAGSSAAPGLTNANVKTYPQELTHGGWQNGEVILSTVPSQQASR
jgi:hypothetical protein